MGDWPTRSLPPRPIITPGMPESMGTGITVGAAALAFGGWSSGVWLTANTALYYPFRLNTHETAYQLLFWVGATSSGNIDVGIYDSEKNLIVSAGSTAMSATVNTWQELNITDTALPPGDYLLGGNCSSGTGTVFRVNTNDEITLGQYPVYEQAVGATALPDPCVPVLATSSTISLVGIGIQFVPTF